MPKIHISKTRNLLPKSCIWNVGEGATQVGYPTRKIYVSSPGVHTNRRAAEFFLTRIRARTHAHARVYDNARVKVRWRIVRRASLMWHKPPYAATKPPGAHRARSGTAMAATSSLATRRRPRRTLRAHRRAKILRFRRAAPRHITECRARAEICARIGAL